MSIFSDIEISVTEPDMTKDDIVEIYEDGEYVDTMTPGEILVLLDKIISDDLNTYAERYDGSDEYFKVIALKIAGKAFAELIDIKQKDKLPF